jgi:phosphotransferase system HPr-like phosphotransfer protein
MKIYRKLLQGILTCFKYLLHLETLRNSMDATTKSLLGLTSLGLRQYNKITLHYFRKKKRKAQKRKSNT